MIFSYINIFTSSTNPIDVALINISEHFLIRSILKNKYNINKISDSYGIPAFILRYNVISLPNIKKKIYQIKSPLFNKLCIRGLSFFKNYIKILRVTRY